jgi:hypothetical protein
MNMKLSVQSSLLSEMMGHLSRLISPGTTPNDLGRFVTVYAKDGKFRVAINRPDVVGVVSVGVESVNDPEILSVDEDGSYSVEGWVCRTFEGKTQGLVGLQYKDNPALVEAMQGDPEIENEGDRGPMPVGQIEVRRPGVRNTAQKMWFQCFSLPTLPRVSYDQNQWVTLYPRGLSNALDRVGIAVSKSAGSIEQSHVKISLDGERIKMCGFQGYMMGLGWSDLEGHGESFCTVVPHDILKSIVGTLDPEVPVTLSQPSEDPPGVVVSQELSYGGSVVGRLVYRVFSGTTKSVNLSKAIDSLDFNCSCKVRGDEFRSVAGDLDDASEDVTTHLYFVPGDEVIRFRKQAAGAGVDQMELPVSDPVGEDVDVIVSSRMLKSIASKCLDVDEPELHFSGNKSLVLVKASEEFRVYFQPFTEA